MCSIAIFKVDKNYLIYFLLHALVYFFMLANYDGLYWDDTILHGQRLSDLAFHFKQAIVAHVGYMHYYLGQILNGIFIYRFLTFIFMFFTAIFLDKILQKISFLTSPLRAYIVLIFLLAPFYGARVALIDFGYTLCYFFFFYAFYLVSKNQYESSKIERVIILLLFFISFFTNSILLFYVIVLMFIYYQQRRYNIQILSILKKHWDFILLPIIFYFFKSQFLQPETIYIGYNHISFGSLIAAIPETVNSFKLTLLGYFIMPISQIKAAYFPYDSLYEFIVLFLFFSLVSSIATLNIKEKINIPYKTLIGIFLLGVFLFYISAFPAYVVNKIPNPLTFNSRLELLMPLGWSMMVVSLVFVISRVLKFPSVAIKLIFSLLLGYYMTFTTITMLQFQKDSFIQASLLEYFKHSSQIKSANRVVIYDYNRFDHVYRRPYAWYEYNFLLKSAYGDESRFATDYLDKRDIKFFQKYIKFAGYNARDYKLSKIDYNIYIRDGAYKLSLPNTIRLLYYKFINKEHYIKLLAETTTIKIKKL